MMKVKANITNKKAIIDVTLLTYILKRNNFTPLIYIVNVYCNHFKLYTRN